ncbi:MAG: pyrroline-5-carboxylate reductase [Phycisphaerae bacterium]
MPVKNYKLGFIGGGNMAEAIARGCMRAGIFKPAEIFVADPASDRRELLTRQLGLAAAIDSAEVAAKSESILLAVKPQKIEEALQQIKPALDNSTVIISIVAAVSTGFIEQQLGATVRVVRVMPNTPVLVAVGASGICRGHAATDADMRFAMSIFGACGVVTEVPESLMDAVTSLSGSGPAYVFYLAEAMAAAGVGMGLSPAAAELLAKQTMIGAGRLLEQSPDSLAELRRKVTSPGGFTEAAINSMASQQFATIIARALAAAVQRGAELSR